MRVVGWDELKLLPEGTVYQEIGRDSWEVGPLTIFGGADLRFNDFNEAPLLPQMNMPAVFDHEGLLHIGVGEDDPVEVIFTPSGFGRDGLYHHDGRRWLIWDEADRARLAGWLLDPARAVREQNDEAHAFVVLPIE